MNLLDVSDIKLDPKKLARRQYPLKLLCGMANAILDKQTGELLEYRHLINRPEHRETWRHSYGNEIGRLAQGIPGRVEGTNTIFFINKNEVPNDRFKDITYGKIVCNYREGKDDPFRSRLVVLGNLVNCPIDCGTPTADLFTVKLLWNSIISTEGAKFMTMDIKNFYLNTPMERYEYLKLRLSDMPEDVIKYYKLDEKATKDGYVYAEVRAGMYGLPQAGILAQKLLSERLNEEGYYQSKTTPGYWKHTWRPISFTLVVDDFGVKYVGEEHAQHLLKVLQQHYEVSTDWEGAKYIGITLDWDYDGRKVHLTMPGYIQKALERFQHIIPKRLQDQPYPHEAVKYGAKIQYAKGEDLSPKLGKNEAKFIQEVTGVFLYLARAVDSTMLTPLSALAAEQSNPTEETMKKCKQFLDYAASQEEAVLTYVASDMVLAIHSDASYLSERNARSRAGGHFYMSDNSKFPPNNGAVLNISQIIKAVMSSAAESELGALFINAKGAVPARMTLEEMGHQQPPTPVQTDNSTAHGVLTNTITPKATTKAMDMRFWWLRDREIQKQFRWMWRQGSTNLADYWTKHHPASHHKAFRPEILTPMSILKALRKAIDAKKA